MREGCIMAGTADHPITIEAAPHRVRGRFAGRIVADSARALLLAEASYNPVSSTKFEQRQQSLRFFRLVPALSGCLEQYAMGDCSR
jgi:uncharacterized protein (DUF427 family)